jgi:hypothetical protein
MTVDAAEGSVKQTIGSGDMRLWWKSEIADSREPIRTGFLAEVESSRRFEIMSAIVIVLNAIVSAVMTDLEIQHLGGDLPVGFHVGEWCFITIYVAEISLRICVHKLFFFCGQDLIWNLFDLFIVLVGIWDLALTAFVVSNTTKSFLFMRALRLLKLAKIFRTFRLMRAFRELAIMLVGFAKSLTQLFWCFIMLLFLFYLVSQILLQGIASYLEEADESVEQLDELLATLVRFPVACCHCTLQSMGVKTGRSITTCLQW